MIRRPTSPAPHARLRAASAIIARGTAAIAVAVLPVALAAPGLGAQTTPPVATPAPTPPAGDGVATAQRSMGVVKVNRDLSIGWIGASGVVVTSDEFADEVGQSATFTVANSKTGQSCYVAIHMAPQRLSVLRCPNLRGAALRVETRYPEPGTPAFMSTLQGSTASTIVTQAGTVTANDVPFMKATRLKFSFLVPGSRSSGSSDSALRAMGAPVVNADGRIVSTLLAAPDDGGAPIGLIPADLTRAISKALTLPASFRAAAIVAVGRRALIPAAVGLVIGIIWAIAGRSGGAVTKILGLAAAGIVGAVLYSVFTVLVVGPQTLLG